MNFFIFYGFDWNLLLGLAVENIELFFVIEIYFSSPIQANDLNKKTLQMFG